MATQYTIGITTNEDLGNNATDLKSGGRPQVVLGDLGNFIAGVAQGTRLATIDMQKVSSAPAQAGSKATLTLASVAAGEVIAINGVKFIAVTGTPLRANGEFKRGVSDTADAVDFLATLAASALSSLVTGTSALGVITLKSADAGSIQNAITVETLGVLAMATLTPTAVAATDTFVINGVTFTAEQEMARGTLTISAGVAGDTCVVNGVTFTCVASAATGNQYNYNASDTTQATNLAAAINGSTSTNVSTKVTASSAAGVVTVRAIASGTAANSIPLVGSTHVTASAATLTSGLATSNNKFDYGDTAAQTIAEMLRAIAASTSALVSRQVFATGTATLVNVYAAFPGLAGNAVTLSGTGGIAASAARLAGGAVAQARGVQATGTVTIASGSGNYTCTINGVNASGTVAYNASDTQTASDLADAINKSQNALVAPFIYATPAAGVVTITAIAGGVAGNVITLAATGTNATVSGARLTNGADPTHAALSGTGVTFSSTFHGARFAGGTGSASGGGSNANAYTS